MWRDGWCVSLCPDHVFHLTHLCELTQGHHLLPVKRHRPLVPGLQPSAGGGHGLGEELHAPANEAGGEAGLVLLGGEDGTL